MYTYEFNSNCTPELLQQQIKSVLVDICAISLDENTIKISFTSELSSEQQAQLLQLVQNHIPINCVQNVTSRQIKKALIIVNKYAEIEAFIAGLSEPQKSIIEIEWRESNEFNRLNPVLIQMTALMGMTSTEVDNLFNLAHTL